MNFINVKYLHVVHSAENIAHCPYLTVLPPLSMYFLKIGSLPVHVIGCVPPEKSSPQFPSRTPPS